MSTAHGQAPTAAGRNKRRLQLVVGFTSVYLIAEVVGGIVTKSLALLADAGHMLTDVGGLVLALIAIRLAERPATPQRTFGYYRIEILAALTNAVVLIVISLYILYEAYQRFRNPPEVASGGMLVVAGIGLVVNLAGMFLLRGSSAESLNMKGAYFEVLSDMITSVGVMVAGVIMLTTGWYYADPIISAGIGLFILPRTWKLLHEAVGVLLEGTPADVDLAAVRATIAAVPDVVGVHDLHVWSLTSGTNALSVHVVAADGAAYGAVLAAIQAGVTSGHKIAHLTVQVEPPEWETGETHL
ncbi:cation diffusion facilitator family transporter [Roseisolibacter agri]|uniref:Cation diffusion facilitator transporter n=1 Tax=Roseisolibacter agri TaxID=2014610 RepID=A0AA37VCY4_9BACT|nr:cation diffusion facilitator family transporter [Roseisolibacter agri]GLC28198.1 cation diffusion facilitator transporter [Roseisolibacter agri]